MTRWSEAEYQAIAQRLKAVENHPKEPGIGGEPQAPDVLEQEEQIALVQWAKKYQAAFPDLLNLFAIPNGGKRAKRVAKMMVAEGVKAGVPDLFLAVPREPHHGLFIEMKRANGGRVSNNQREWISRLKRQGYKVVVCHGFPAARKAIQEYLEVAIDGHRG